MENNLKKKCHKCYVCKDDIHPVNLKEALGTDGKMYYFHYICFNRVKEETTKILESVQKQVDKINNEILHKSIIKIILLIFLIYYVIRWFLTRG